METEKSLQESLNRYRILVNSLDEGFMVIEMLYDLEGQPIDFIFTEINPAHQSAHSSFKSCWENHERVFSKT